MSTADQVTWGTSVISYRYRFGQAKTLAITVQPDLSVLVTAPLGTSPDRIRAKVCKRGAWIRKAWREFERFHPFQPPREYVPGESHRYLGRQYRLRVVTGSAEAVALRRGYLEVTTNRQPTARVLRPLVQQWYAEHANNIFQERLAACQRLASVEGIALPPLTVRKMATRWGSCTPKGHIALNPELIKAPRECIDYVIMHELCHLVEHNHSPNFWRLLKRLMPDWENRREQLNKVAAL